MQPRALPVAWAFAPQVCFCFPWSTDGLPESSLSAASWCPYPILLGWLPIPVTHTILFSTLTDLLGFPFLPLCSQSGLSTPCPDLKACVCRHLQAPAIPSSAACWVGPARPDPAFSALPSCWGLLPTTMHRTPERSGEGPQGTGLHC